MPDPTQSDPASQVHDPKSDPDSPRWKIGGVRPVEAIQRFASPDELRAT